MAFYERMAGTASRLLARFAQGEVALVRRDELPGVKSWEDPRPLVTTQTPLNAVVEGVNSELVGTPAGSGGPVFMASDLVVTCAPPEDYRDGDTLTIDGKEMSILRVEREPAAGQPAIIRFYVRA